MIVYCNTVITMFLLAIIFLDSLLPECYYEAISLDILLSNHHI